MRNNIGTKKIDIDKTNYTPIATIKQEDNVIMKLELYKDGEAFDITRQTVTLAAKRSDKVIIEQIDGFSIDTNSLTIELKNNINAKIGLVYLELNIKDETGSMTTLDFYLKVVGKILGEDSLDASDNIASLEKIQDEFIKSSNALLDTVIKNEDDRVDAEAIRQGDESTRSENEASRINAESERMQAENTRVTAEEERVAAEIIREQKIEEFGSQVTKMTDDYNKALANVTNGNESATNSEIVQARGKYLNLGERLNKLDVELIEKDMYINQASFLEILNMHVTYKKIILKKIISNPVLKFDVILINENNRHLTYNFENSPGITYYDDQTIFNESYVGNLIKINEKNGYVNFDINKAINTEGFTFSTTHPNAYTTVVGQTIKFDFTGCGFYWLCFKDNRGGVWEFTIDDEKKYEFSTWNETAIEPTDGMSLEKLEVNFKVMDDLKFGKHSCIAKFIGDDKNHPSSSGQSRGWFRYNKNEPNKYHMLFEIKKITKNEKEKQLLVGWSNKDFAISCKKEDGSSQWIPQHNQQGTCFDLEEKIFICDGKEIDFYELDDNTEIECDNFTFIQNMKGQLTGEIEPRVKISTIHSVNTKGEIAIDGKIEFLKDTTILNGYVNMIPFSNLFTNIKSSIGNVYNCIYPVVPTSTKFVKEKDLTNEFFIYSNLNNDICIAVKMHNINDSYRMGATDRRNPLLWVEHRNKEMNKIYPQIFENSNMKTGDIVKFGATYKSCEMKKIANFCI